MLFPRCAPNVAGGTTRNWGHPNFFRPYFVPPQLQIRVAAYEQYPVIAEKIAIIIKYDDKRTNEEILG